MRCNNNMTLWHIWFVYAKRRPFDLEINNIIKGLKLRDMPDVFMTRLPFAHGNTIKGFFNQ